MIEKKLGLNKRKGTSVSVSKKDLDYIGIKTSNSKTKVFKFIDKDKIVIEISQCK